MSAENLSQILDFLVHTVEHLPHCVDLDFAALEALQREADRQVLGQLHNHGFVRLGVRCLRRQARKGLFQCVLRAARQLSHLLLKRTCRRGHAALPGTHVSETRQGAQDRINLFLAGLAGLAAPASTSPRSTTASECPRDSSGPRQTCYHVRYLHTSIATALPKAPNPGRHLASCASASAYSFAQAGRAASAGSKTRTCIAAPACSAFSNSCLARNSGGPWASTASTNNSAARRTLRRGYQFEQLLGIVQPLSEFILFTAERSRGNLRRHAGLFQP